MPCHPAVLRVCLVIALAAVLLAAPSARAQSLEFVPQPPSGQFFCPETLSVELTIDAAVVDLRGYSLVLSYDPVILNPVSVSPGSLVDGAACGNLLQWLDPGNNDGSLEVDLALLGCSTNGPGSVLTIVFEGIGEGNSGLDCVQTIFRDSLNAEIPVNCAPIVVTYSCPVPNLPPSWGSLKAVY